MQTTQPGRPWVAVSLGALVLLAFGAMVTLATVAASWGSAAVPNPTDADQMRTDIALLRAQVKKLEGDLALLRVRSETLETRVDLLPSGVPRLQPLSKETK